MAAPKLDPLESSEVTHARIDMRVTALENADKSLVEKVDKVLEGITGIHLSIQDLQHQVNNLKASDAVKSRTAMAAVKWVGGIVAVIVGAFLLRHLGLS